MTVESDIINRGIALLELGRAREAERHFRRAIAGDPSHADARVLLARSLLQQERYAEAADAAHRALAEAPEDLGGLRVIAAAHLGLGEHEEAFRPWTWP